ncbi:hypothetical protein KEM48_011597 [Puccinia striiformis f. sp. tritici PST-130]|nr:hypothetical protein KEM48_011597 [Puccinia striiformis f. sp. tritici PST-130]
MSHHPPFKQVEQTRPDFDAGHSLRYTKTPQPDGTSVKDSITRNVLMPRFSITRSFRHELIRAFPDRDFRGHDVLYGFGRGDKDTAANIRATKEFVIAIISEPFIEAANYTSIDTPSGISEWTLSGLTPEPSTKVKPARVQEAAVNMECELEHLHEMHDPTDPKKLTQVIVIGRIKAWHIKKEVLVDGNTSGPMVAFDKLMPIARLGGISYCRALECFELPRPIWKEEKEKEEVKKLLADQDK